MSPDDQIRDVLPRLEDGVTLAPGTYQLLLWRLDEAEKKTLEHRMEIKATLGRIFDQAVKTNGRLTSLETSRSFIKGVLWAFGLVLGGIGYLVTWWVMLHTH